MDEDVDRGVRSLDAMDIEILDLDWTIRDALRRPQNGQYQCAVGLTPLVDIGVIECINRLVIGVFELLLVDGRIRPEGIDLAQRRTRARSESGPGMTRGNLQELRGQEETRV
jgi:hypothetical protein